MLHYQKLLKPLSFFKSSQIFKELSTPLLMTWLTLYQKKKMTWLTSYYINNNIRPTFHFSLLFFEGPYWRGLFFHFHLDFLYKIIIFSSPLLNFEWYKEFKDFEQNIVSMCLSKFFLFFLKEAHSVYFL